MGNAEMDFGALVHSRRSVRDFPSNAVKSDRTANGDFVHYVGFED
jgi:hypothetical protein